MLDSRTFTLTDSELERRFLRLVRKAGLRKPETGRRVNGFKVDFYWPGLGLVVEITDTGSGMPEVVKARAFEPFFTTKDVGKGTGLGLDISRRIVQRHLGTIDLHTGAGRTEFRVTLPASKNGPVIDHEVVERVLFREALGVDPDGDSVRPLPAGRPLPQDADAVVLLAPVPYADVLAVHAAGRRMPRKATYFTPKPRSGLVLAEL